VCGAPGSGGAPSSRLAEQRLLRVCDERARLCSRQADALSKREAPSPPSAARAERRVGSLGGARGQEALRGAAAMRGSLPAALLVLAARCGAAPHAGARAARPCTPRDRIGYRVGYRVGIG